MQQILISNTKIVRTYHWWPAGRQYYFTLSNTSHFPYRNQRFLSHKPTLLPHLLPIQCIVCKNFLMIRIVEILWTATINRNQSINQPINQPTNQLINQSINFYKSLLTENTIFSGWLHRIWRIFTSFVCYLTRKCSRKTTM